MIYKIQGTDPALELTLHFLHFERFDLDGSTWYDTVLSDMVVAEGNGKAAAGCCFVLLFAVVKVAFCFCSVRLS